MKKIKYNTKKNKGITMVSLVVTIIILIILAGVSLNLTLGDNGLITMAKMAKENMELAQIEDQKKLNELYTQIEKGGEFEGDITVGELQQTVESLQGTVDDLTNQLENEQAQKAELEKRIEELEKQLQQEETNKAELERQLEELNTQLEEEKAKEAELEKQVTEKDKQIGSLNAELESKKTELASKEETITKLQSAKDALDKQVADLQKQVSDLNQQVADLNKKLPTGNAVEADVLSGKTFSTAKGISLTGSMPNNKAESKTLNAGQSYTIPKGYHDGTGKVTANSLASQTQGTATAADIASGKTAYVNGVQITGEGKVSGSTSATISITGTTHVKDNLRYEYLTITINGNTYTYNFNFKKDDRYEGISWSTTVNI